MQRIKLGLIGCGIIAAGHHFPAISKLKSKFKVCMLANPRKEKAEYVRRLHQADKVTSNYKEILSNVNRPKKTACRCGEILKGLIEPTDCSLYNKSCTPESPKGACMVSAEGSCAIYYHLGK